MELNPSAAFVAASTSAILGFGTALYVKAQFKGLTRTKVQKVLLWIATIFLGYGISGILGEFIHSLLIGLPIRLDEVMRYLIVHIAIVPSTLVILIWLLKPKPNDVLQGSSFEQVGFNQRADDSSNSSRQHRNAPAQRGEIEITEFSSSTLLPKEEDVWELIAKEYESQSRRTGLHAKLFVDYNGDETKIKVAYLKQRVLEVSNNTGQKESNKQIDEVKSSLSNLQLIKQKKFSLGTVSGIECLLLHNGKGVVLTKGRDYRIYVNEKTMTVAAANFKKTGEYLEEGFIELVKREELFN
jgi:hypothetical protein